MPGLPAPSLPLPLTPPEPFHPGCRAAFKHPPSDSGSAPDLFQRALSPRFARKLSPRKGRRCPQALQELRTRSRGLSPCRSGRCSRPPAPLLSGIALHSLLPPPSFGFPFLLLLSALKGPTLKPASHLPSSLFAGRFPGAPQMWRYLRVCHRPSFTTQTFTHSPSVPNPEPGDSVKHRAGEACPVHRRQHENGRPMRGCGGQRRGPHRPHVLHRVWLRAHLWNCKGHGPSQHLHTESCLHWSRQRENSGDKTCFCLHGVCLLLWGDSQQIVNMGSLLTKAMKKINRVIG